VNERIANLKSLDRLVDEAAPDEEIIGLWQSAVEALEDASLTNRRPNRRLTSAYDAGRVAALAVVRAANLRVRARNHHEVTLAVAGFLGGSALESLLHEFQALRMDRIEIEYGWTRSVSIEEVDRATSRVRAIIEAAASSIRDSRPTAAAHIVPPA
jgi:hypothetical protein